MSQSIQQQSKVAYGRMSLAVEKQTLLREWANTDEVSEILYEHLGLVPIMLSMLKFELL